MPELRTLAGWGRSAPTMSTVREVGSRAEVTAALAGANGRGILARGLGRSYGDAAQNAGGLVLDLHRLRGIDVHRLEEDGTVRLEAGATLEELIRLSVPRGWFLPVAPGTRQVTLGGAVASDVHGKDHHLSGSLMRHVTRLVLATPVGVLEIGPESELFAATFGGMGLTGVVLEVELRLMRIPTSRVLVDTHREDGFDAVIARLDADSAQPYSVAWVDCMARGRGLGRGVAGLGRWAEPDELPEDDAADPFAYEAPGGLPFPPVGAVANLLSRPAALAFNEAWFRKAPRERRDEVQRLSAFFHPLDGLRGWNAVYGPRGFVQYQMAVPLDEVEVVRRVIELLAAARVPSALAVLKRLGPSSGGHMSFPIPGWTLAVDVPSAVPGLGALLDRCDELVAACGGRVYLAKDARVRPDLVREMYPRLREWQAVRAEYDPDGVLLSDQARRLGFAVASA